MELTFQLFPVIPPLKGYIEKIWLFESSGKLPDSDLKLIVPNGRPLLLLPYKNGLAANMGGKHYVAPGHKLQLVGISDRSSLIDSMADAATASIGVEFSPAALYRFFPVPSHTLANNLNIIVDVLGREAIEAEKRMSDLASPQEKVAALQSWLLQLFNQKNEDPVFEHCIRVIGQTKGGVSIAQLEKDTGYSSRWLNCKFKENLGISPKNFSSIIRFQHYYQVMILQNPARHLKRPFYHQYYDQSHFIKDFKRFTGMTPARLIETENKFGKLFY